MTNKIIGSRQYPCGHRTNMKGVDSEGTYSRRCDKCGTYWLLHVEPAHLADRFPGLLKLRWATS